MDSNDVSPPVASTSTSTAGRGRGASVAASEASGSGGADTASNRLVCTFPGCVKSFGKLSHRTRHEKTHNTEMPFECYACQKRFKRRDVCTRHETSVHAKSRKGPEPIRNVSEEASSSSRKRSLSSSSEQPRPSPAPPAVALAPPVFPPSLHLPQPPSQQNQHLPVQFPLPLPPTMPTSFLPSSQLGRPASPPPPWSLHAERSSQALSNMAPFDFFPATAAEGVDVSASFDASLGWYNDTEMDFLSIFAGRQDGAQLPTVAPRSGYDTPSMDWLKLLGSATVLEPDGEHLNPPAGGTESSGSGAATSAAGQGVAMGSTGVGETAGSGGAREKDVMGGAAVGAMGFPPSPSSTSATFPQPPPVAVPSATTGQQQPPFAVTQARSPAVAAVASVEAESLATPSDGGGPENPSTNWPHVYEPVAPVDALSLPAVPLPAVPNPPLLLFEEPGGAVSKETRDVIMQFVSDSHSSPWWAVSLASFPSAAVLSICIKLYISRFHDTFPILDSEAVAAGTVPPILLLACAAVGAMYRPEFEGLGVALTEVVRRTALWKREQDPRSAFEVSVIQAWLLSSVSGLFCGSRKLYQHAEIARAGLITAARRMNLLRETTSFVEDLLARKTPTPEELETAQKEDELRLRLGWGIYIFDNLVSTLLNLQPVVSIAEIADSTFLPEESLLPPSKGRRRFRQVLAVLLTEGRVEGFLTPLSTAIIQLTLFRLCLDASYIDTMLSSVLNVQRTGTYRLVFTPDIKQNPQELLDRIGVAWHSSSSSITPLHVQATALAYHATLAFSCNDFLSLAKVSAGKYGSARAMVARETVKQLATTDAVAVRRVLVRSMQLSALLERHRYNMPAEAIWITDAAMAVWAIVKFARPVFAPSPSSLSHRSTINWSDCQAIEPWILSGGPLSLRNGLGEADSVTPEQVLRKFSENLEDLPWGLSRKFRAVLLQLCQEE